MPLGENENKLDISAKMKHFISSPAVCERLSVRVCVHGSICAHGLLITRAVLLVQLKAGPITNLKAIKTLRAQDKVARGNQLDSVEEKGAFLRYLLK